MPAVHTVLVVGGGAAGAAVATLLARGGVAVDLVDSKPDVAVAGSGITLQGNALRVLREVGVWDKAHNDAFGFESMAMRLPDPQATIVVERADTKIGGPDLPSTAGMQRPVLAGLLLQCATEAGVKVRFATTITALDSDDQGVGVTLSDGSTARYDLVIGADGIHSSVRRLMHIDTEPQPIGIGIWRAITARPASVFRTEIFHGGPCLIAGYCPTSPDSLYAYLAEPLQDRSTLTAGEQVATVKALSAAYHGPWDEIRELVTDADQLNYSQFETHVVDRPWNRGRVVVIGDAAHSCPPTIAQGAAQALEDASVLAELLLDADALDDAFWAAFMDRRYPRVKAVVDASVQITSWLLEGVRGEPEPLLGGINEMLRAPA